MSNNLRAPQVADNQDQKEITINNAIGRLDAALTVVSAIAGDGSFTVAADAFAAAGSFAIGPGTAAADFTMTVLANPRGLFVVSNASGFNVTVEITGQSATSPVLANGDVALLWSDGVSVRKFAAAV